MEYFIDFIPIDCKTREILQDNGLTTKKDFKDLKLRDLMVLGIDQNEARTVFKYLTSNEDVKENVGVSAFSLLQQKSMSETSHIVTFSEKVDSILGGGFEIGSVSELCGTPGIGKTQFSMQLSLNVQLPQDLGGCEGESLYIDCEGSFVVDRVRSIGTGFVKKVNGMYEKMNLQKDGKPFELDDVLKRIWYYRIKDYLELVSLVNILPSFLKANPKIKLVIIDSITFHFRHGFDDLGKRARILQGLAMKLSEMASKQNTAIVVVNQVTTKISNAGAYLAPALGSSWGHACKNRIVLYKSGTSRCLFLYKSPNLKPGKAMYKITNEGIRDDSKKRERMEEIVL